MNKTITLATIALVAVIMGMSAFAPAWAPPGDPNGDGDEVPDVKVTLCHVPPGNPENAHTIIVNEEDVAEHIAHGDVLGSCNG